MLISSDRRSYDLELSDNNIYISTVNKTSAYFSKIIPRCILKRTSWNKEFVFLFHSIDSKRL